MKKSIKAILCDLDGVVTKTAKVHARAWKMLFDDFLPEYTNDRTGNVSFDIKTDYRIYVDGKPRLDGIRSFLEARNITIPEGVPEDSPETVSVNGLGRKKNQLFNDLLEKEGVEVVLPTLRALEEWKNKGMKVAVVSSSKNCRNVLAAAGADGLFEVVVDGIIAAEEGLAGKPEPDTFLYAANKLNINPEEAAVVEDAEAGIRAAVRGGFGMVVGIVNDNEHIKKSGADVSVKDLGELYYTGRSLRYPQESEKINFNFFEEQIEKDLDTKKAVFFFDYDGTLTPIVSRPEDAILSDVTREKVSELASLVPVTIISGRDKDDVKNLVRLKNLYYAGSHGFDIEGPGNVVFQHSETENIFSLIKTVTGKLDNELKEFKGIQIEPKKFAVAVHYRNAQPKESEDIIGRIKQVVKQTPGLKTGEGKMVVEVRPDIDWDKGKAMHWIAGKLKIDKPEYHYLYIGDDVTDEDAFKSLPENGTGVLVGHHQNLTYADYRIEKEEDVNNLLDYFMSIIRIKYA